MGKFFDIVKSVIDYWIGLPLWCDAMIGMILSNLLLNQPQPTEIATLK